jgi:hypothetical protein
MHSLCKNKKIKCLTTLLLLLLYDTGTPPSSLWDQQIAAVKVLHLVAKSPGVNVSKIYDLNIKSDYDASLQKQLCECLDQVTCRDGT